MTVSVTPINRKRAGDVLYVAGMINKGNVYLYAETDGEARQRAIEYFRPKKDAHRKSIWAHQADQSYQPE